MRFVTYKLLGNAFVIMYVFHILNEKVVPHMDSPVTHRHLAVEPPASFEALRGLVVELHSLTAVALQMSHREREEQGLLAKGSDLYHKILEAALAFSSEAAGSVEGHSPDVMLAPERNTDGNPPIKDLCEMMTTYWVDGKGDGESYYRILAMCKGLKPATPLGRSATAV